MRGHAGITERGLIEPPDRYIWILLSQNGISCSSLTAITKIQDSEAEHAATDSFGARAHGWGSEEFIIIK